MGKEDNVGLNIKYLNLFKKIIKRNKFYLNILP